LTWENIIDEEPLEGDHWKSWADQDTSTEGLSDEDAFEVDDRTSKPKVDLIVHLNDSYTISRVLL
jgi:hypothetical protein